MKKTFAVCLLLLAFVILALAQDGRRTSARERRDRDDVVTLKGEISQVLMPLATFKSEGKEYTVHLGPVWFWRENDYKLETGAVEIRGEVETEKEAMHLYPYAITQGKTTITLASEDGSPKWSKSAGMMKGMHRGAAGNRCSHGSGGHGCQQGCCRN